MSPPTRSPRLHWFAGVVKQVSDGKIARASGLEVYAKGTVLIQFDAQPGEPPEGTEAWTVLPPTKFNKASRNSWRYDLDYERV